MFLRYDSVDINCSSSCLVHGPKIWNTQNWLHLRTHPFYLIFIHCVRLYNFINHDTSIIKTLNPIHVLYYYLKEIKKTDLSFPGGIVLSITGGD